MNNNQSPKINVAPKIHFINIVDRQFLNPETKQTVNYSVLELGLKIDGEIIPLEFPLSKRTNAKLLIMASETKNWLNEDDVNM